MVQGRKELREARQEKKRLKIRIAVIVVAVVTLIVAAYVSYALARTSDDQKNPKMLNAIEQLVPNSVDAFFASENDTADAATYIQSIASTNTEAHLTNADYVGVALKGGKSYLYATSAKPSELTQELDEQNIKYEKLNNDVILVSGNGRGEGVSDEDGSLWGSAEYQSNRTKNNKSIAYMTNANSPQGVIPSEAGMPEQTWKWQGTYVEGEWVGQALGVKSSDFNLNKFDSWLVNHKSPDLSWLRERISKEGSEVTMNLPTSRFTDLKLPSYENQITDITVKINAEGRLKLVLERN